jgi:hypothetical protein
MTTNIHFISFHTKKLQKHGDVAINLTPDSLTVF